MAELTASERAHVAQALSELGARIDPVLQELFPPDSDDFLSPQFWHHMKGGGKRVRPALCLLCCEGLGGDPEKALYFAAAAEIIHNMLLIHDDVEDGDTVRRDAPTVWARFGLGNAVNAGDYMLGRAYHAILQSPVDTATRERLVREFTETYELTCRGQALDINSRAKEAFTVDEYLEMVTLKTGRYLALGMVGGGIIAGAGQAVIAQIRELGTSMGPAFQIRDDLLDLTAGKGRGGVAGNDIREGKPSILYAHALAEAHEDERRQLLEIMRTPRERTTDAEVQQVVGLYGRCGSMEFARRTADRLTRHAFNTLESIPLKNRGLFRRILCFLAQRES